MLIDKYMPSFDVREYHEISVRADTERAWAALRALDLNRSGIVRLIFGVRALPSWLRGERPEAPPRSSLLEETLALGWRILAEEPEREIVVGAVTQPWVASVRFHGLPGPEFIAFSEPGFTKIVWNLAVRSAGPGRSVLSTETRVEPTDPASRRRFRRYWLVVGLGVRLVRVLGLRIVKRHLERSSRSPAATREPLKSYRA
jgi:hypothetical protein